MLRELSRLKQISRATRMTQKRIARFYTTTPEHRQSTKSQKSHSFFNWLRLESFLSLFRFKKKQLQEIQPVRIVKPRFDVEKIHLTVDLTKSIQEIQNELEELYRQNYKDKKSWGSFDVTFKVGHHEMTWHVDSSPNSRTIRVVFNLLFDFIRMYREKLQGYTTKAVPLDLFATPVRLNFQQCFEKFGRTLFLNRCQEHNFSASCTTSSSERSNV